MTDPYAGFEGQGVPREELPIDRRSRRHPALTYREIAEELDSLADLRGEEVWFVADCIDEPERIRTPRQLDWLDDLYEKRL